MKANQLVIDHWYIFSREWGNSIYTDICQYTGRRFDYEVGFSFRFADGLRVWYYEENIEWWMTPCSKACSEYLNLFAPEVSE